MIARNRDTSTLPDDRVKTLVKKHRGFKDEPLLLAVQYVSSRHPRDVSVLEVIKGFGRELVDPDRELFEVTFGSSRDFALPSGQQLRLVLTSPKEFEVALREDWPGAVEVKKAVRRNKASKVYAERSEGSTIWKLLQPK